MASVGGVSVVGNGNLNARIAVSPVVSLAIPTLSIGRIDQVSVSGNGDCNTGFTDIARFGQKKLDLLRRFRPFADGTPSHDQLGDIFAALDADAFRTCFVRWVAELTDTPAELIAIDGKTSRRSGRKGAKDAIHMVSAFAARQNLVLAQKKVSEKSNEILAIPALLDLLSMEGAVVTIDAMGCQRRIARKIIDKKADYILGLKGNQGTLCKDVELFVEEQLSALLKVRSHSQRSP